ncbi:hypothetical protein UPYG_G00247910 [Umbra pygmaea]|uniref:Uncharacterized protein n=1 Tax=Umbra pygmaea TaxID=75934 RepID=A0ABD0W7D7_UMBPY
MFHMPVPERNHKMQDIHNIMEYLEIQQEQIKEIKNTLAVIKTGMESLEDLNLTCYETNLDMKTQAQYIEKKIRKQFQDLHQFLEEEQEARISAVMNEKQSKMKMNIGPIQAHRLEPKLLRIDESKHLDNLKLTVWKKMEMIVVKNETFHYDLEPFFVMVGFIGLVIVLVIGLVILLVISQESVPDIRSF